MIFIYAGNQSQARSCANWLELHPEGWRYLTDGHELSGTDHPKVIKFGTYWDRPAREKESIENWLEGSRAFVSRLED